MNSTLEAVLRDRKMMDQFCEGAAPEQMAVEHHLTVEEIHECIERQRRREHIAAEAAAP